MRCLVVCYATVRICITAGTLITKYILIYGGTIWPPASDGRDVEVSSSAWEHRIPAPPSAGMKDVTGQGEASRRRGTAARGTSDLAGRALLGCAAWSRVPFARVLRHSRPGQHIHPSPSPPPLFPILRFSSSTTKKRKRDVQGQLARSEPEGGRQQTGYPSFYGWLAALWPI